MAMTYVGSLSRCARRRWRAPCARAGVLPRLFAFRLGPLDHVDMPAVDALKQQDRGGVCGRASQGSCLASFMRAAQRRQISLVFGWSSMSGSLAFATETGNIVRRASVEATSVVADRARVRRSRRIRSLRISGRPAQTAAALAGACGQAASHPRIGGTGVPSPGLSEQASN